MHRNFLFDLDQTLLDFHASEYKALGVVLRGNGLFVSEDMGVAKPSKAYFDICLRQIGEPKESCIVIGDSLSSDMLGAKNASLRSVWFMPAGDIAGAMGEYDIDFCASSFDELYEVLRRWAETREKDGAEREAMRHL